MDIQLQPNRDEFNPAFALPRPPGTRIEVIDHSDGVTIRIPAPHDPRLKARVIAGSILTAVGLLGLLGLVGMIGYAALLQGSSPGDNSGEDGAPFLLLLWEVSFLALPSGLAVTLRTLSFLRWRIELSINGVQLRLRRVRTFSETRQVWPIQAIRGVYVTGGARLARLCIDLWDGLTFNVPNYNGPVPYPTSEELEWIAALLHGYLNPRSPIEAQTARPKPDSPDGITPGETGVARP